MEAVEKHIIPGRVFLSPAEGDVTNELQDGGLPLAESGSNLDPPSHTSVSITPSVVDINPQWVMPVSEMMTLGLNITTKLPDQVLLLTTEQQNKIKKNPLYRQIGAIICNELSTIYLSKKEQEFYLSSNKQLAKVFGVSRRKMRQIAATFLSPEDYLFRYELIHVQSPRKGAEYSRNQKITWRGRTYASYEEATVGDEFQERVDGFELQEGTTYQVHMQANGIHRIADFVLRSKSDNKPKVVEWHPEIPRQQFMIFSRKGEGSIIYGQSRYEIVALDPQFKDAEVIIIPYVLGESSQHGKVIIQSLYDILKQLYQQDPNSLKKPLPDEKEFKREFNRKLRKIKREVEEERAALELQNNTQNSKIEDVMVVN